MKPTPVLDEKEIRRVYCTLMEEVRMRFEIINKIHRNDARFPEMMVREICYLQFRFLCEIVAVGCLVAHGDVPLNRALRRAYDPQKIMGQLETINPHFYPRPIETRVFDAGAQKLHTVTPQTDGKHLTKAELISLWSRSGDVLHRSPMAKVLKPRAGKRDDYSDIFMWTGKFTALLNHHWITLIENKRGLLASLKSNEDGRAAVSFMDFSTAEGTVTMRTTRAIAKTPIAK